MGLEQGGLISHPRVQRQVGTQLRDAFGYHDSVLAGFVASYRKNRNNDSNDSEADLRSGRAVLDAVRAGQECAAAGPTSTPSDSLSAHQVA